MVKRKLCLVGIVLVGIILIMYLTKKEYFFPALGISWCEQEMKEDQKSIVAGRIYKKVKKEDQVILYLKHIRIQNISKAAADERLLVYLKSENVPGIGQDVKVEGKVSFFQDAPNPGNFNQKNYYKQQNIQASLKNGKLLGISGKKNIIKEKLWNYRNAVSEKICEVIGKEKGGILCAMLLGDTAYTEDEITEIYRVAGIGHLIAISGLHISFLGNAVYQLLRKTGRSFGISAGIAGTIIWLYVEMSGMSISSLRAMLMFLIRMGAEITGREYDGFTALAAAEIILLLENPLRLFTAGFQLSFCAVIGVCMSERNETETWKDKWMTSLNLQLTVLPVLLYHYYEVCIYSMLWNLLVIPLSPGIIGTGIGGMLIEFIPGAVGKTLQKIAWSVAAWILTFYEGGSRFLVKIPGARWIPGRPYLWQIVVYYLLVIAWKLRKKKENIVVILVLLTVMGLPQWKKGQMEIYMLDVGQGDCFFIRDGSGKNYLIDGGSSTVSSVGKYRIEPFLKSKGVKELDAVWVTHGDADHQNGIEELFARKRYGVRIARLILPDRIYWDENLAGLAKAAKNSGTEVYTMESGKIYDSDKLQMLCLWPGDGIKAEDANENSLVLSLSYGNFTMLFTGDLEKEGEEKVTEVIADMQEKNVLPKRYDILKLGHHGSKNASGEMFLQTIKPKRAFCSAGKKNRYGHPHEETVERLAKWGVSLYNTKDRGAVMLCTDGRKYCILKP